MICNRFIHVAIGDTGEGVVRNALHKWVHAPKTDKGGELPPLLRFTDRRAHMTISYAREKGSTVPAFTFTRNPFDWYISYWMHEIKLKHFEGRFSDWYKDRHGLFTKHWIRYTHWEKKEAVAEVGKFEFLEEDCVRILHKLAPKELSESYIHTWFPEAFRQWCNRPWIEGVEQWMRHDLYDDRMQQRVEHDEEWALDRWGYHFDQFYDFKPGPIHGGS